MQHNSHKINNQSDTFSNGSDLQNLSVLFEEIHFCLKILVPYNLAKISILCTESTKNQYSHKTLDHRWFSLATTNIFNTISVQNNFREVQHTFRKYQISLQNWFMNRIIDGTDKISYNTVPAYRASYVLKSQLKRLTYKGYRLNLVSCNCVQLM